MQNQRVEPVVGKLYEYSKARRAQKSNQAGHKDTREVTEVKKTDVGVLVYLRNIVSGRATRTSLESFRYAYVPLSDAPAAAPQLELCKPNGNGYVRLHADDIAAIVKGVRDALDEAIG